MFTERSTYAQRSDARPPSVCSWNSTTRVWRCCAGPQVSALLRNQQVYALQLAASQITMHPSESVTVPRASGDAPAKPCIVRILDCSITLPLDVMLTENRVNSKPVRLSPAGSLQYALRFVPYEPVRVACAGRTSHKRQPPAFIETFRPWRVVYCVCFPFSPAYVTRPTSYAYSLLRHSVILP